VVVVVVVVVLRHQQKIQLQTNEAAFDHHAYC